MELVVIQWTGQRLLVIEAVYTSSCHIHRYPQVVQHEADGADSGRLTAKHVCYAAKQSIGASSQPEAEQRIVVGLREVVVK